MQIEKKDTYSVVIPEEGSGKLFFNVFKKNIESFQKKHVVIDFSQLFNTSLQDILLFLDIANDFRENGTSFVIVCNGIPIDDIPDEISVVPSMPEALDVLEMDEIERDLMNS